jgi:hypothetical protein
VRADDVVLLSSLAHAVSCTGRVAEAVGFG